MGMARRAAWRFKYAAWQNGQRMLASTNDSNGIAWRRRRRDAQLPAAAVTRRWCGRPTPTKNGGATVVWVRRGEQRGGTSLDQSILNEGCDSTTCDDAVASNEFLKAMKPRSKYIIQLLHFHCCSNLTFSFKIILRELHNGRA
ncbi:hypothetical protein Scep_006751 [Stephania cephalantha]|uniref:Uncharacterized protein n=1 Tax=Stephania cephalantha TaxID=152367 RepID=A0AAP0KAH3_9MAGN